MTEIKARFVFHRHGKKFEKAQTINSSIICEGPGHGYTLYEKDPFAENGLELIGILIKITDPSSDDDCTTLLFDPLPINPVCKLPDKAIEELLAAAGWAIRHQETAVTACGS